MRTSSPALPALHRPGPGAASRSSVRRGLPAALLCVCAAALAGQDAKGPEPPSTQRIAEADLTAAANPQAAQALFSVSLRRPFSGVALDPDTYLQAGATLGLTPAYAQGGAFLEWQGLPFLQLRVQGDSFRYFGAYGALLSYPDTRGRYGTKDLDDRKDDARAGSAARAMAQPALQARFGRFYVRHQATLSWFRFAGEGPCFYEPESDFLMTRRDRLQDSLTQAGMEFSMGNGLLQAGPVYQLSRTREGGLVRKRAGLSAFWQANDFRCGYGRPRMAILLARVQEDPNRKGQIYAVVSLGTSWMR